MAGDWKWMIVKVPKSFCDSVVVTMLMFHTEIMRKKKSPSLSAGSGMITDRSLQAKSVRNFESILSAVGHFQTSCQLLPKSRVISIRISQDVRG